MRHHSRSIGPACAWLVLTALAGAQIQTCQGYGLSVAGGKLGDPWSFTIFGPPNAAAILASDVASGPVGTPVGPVCLGLTPALATLPVTLDSSGAFAQSGMLPLAAPIAAGSTLYTQALVADPSQPGGYNLTNGAAITFRPPRMGVFRWGGNPATTLDMIDPVNGTVAFSAGLQPCYVPNVIRLPSRGWYGWRQSGGAFLCVDSFTGAPVLTIPGVAPPGSIVTETVVASDDGSLLFAFAYGPGNAVYVNTWSLATGTLLSTWTATIPFFSNRGLYPIAGTSLVYACDGQQIYVVDGAAGTLVTTIALPGLLHGQWGKFAFLSQGYLYAITTVLPPGTQAGQLVVIDTSAHLILGTYGPIFGSPIDPLTIAPGSAGGLAFWLAVQTPGGNLMLTELSLSTFTATPVTPIMPSLTPVQDCQPSAGGTELVLLDGNGSVAVVNVITGQVTQIAAGAGSIGVVSSGTLRRAYALVNSSVISFPTDPVGPATTIPLPPPTATIWETSLVSN